MYGRYWQNVGGTFKNSANQMWRVASPLNGDFQGGYLAWRDVGTMFDMKGATYDTGAEAPYVRALFFMPNFFDSQIWNPGSQVYFGFENVRSIQAKVCYCI